MANQLPYHSNIRQTTVGEADQFSVIGPNSVLLDSTVTQIIESIEHAPRTRLSQAATAAAMMSPPIYVHEHETIVDAFRKMREANLRGLPIMDANMHVTGYIDLLELVLVWMRAEERKGDAG